MLTAHVPPFDTVVTNTPRPGETPEQTAARTAPRGNYEDRYPKDDVVKEPSHYTRFAIQPKTFIMRNKMEFWRGNIVKYASRAGFKLYEGKTVVESEIIDLEKAINYCQSRINQLNGEVEL